MSRRVLRKMFVGALFGSFVLTVLLCAGSVKTGFGGFYDLSMRYHEVSCAHTGVNPFHIWNRTVESGKYRGIARPDIQEEISADEKRPQVHAYPPWHVTFFWWYGWLSWEAVVVWVSSLSCLLFAASFLVFQKWEPEGGSSRMIYWCLLTGLMLPSFQSTFVQGNYGCILLLGSLILVLGCEKLNSLLLGAAWALIMIKPQVGVLFFWPLLFAKRYAAIAIAVILCLLATLWPAHVYGESPIDLVRQIQQIGAPYLIERKCALAFLGKLVGQSGVVVFGMVCFMACAVWSFVMRKCSSALLKFLPVFTFIPVWTYSQSLDRVVLWPVYVLMAAELARGFNWSGFLLALSFPFFYCAYFALSFSGIVASGRYDIPYVCHDLVHLSLILVFAVQICRRNSKG